MTEISLKEMLEAGVHFGHKTDRWNPKMRPFIFTQRNGVHIFDLAQTKLKLEEAQRFVGQTAKDGGTILFVGTKNQTKDVIKAAAEKAEMPYLVERWPGGMLTNFKTILERLRYMKDAEEKTSSASGLTKKETLNLTRELDKLKEIFDGIRELNSVPDILIVSDILKECIAVREAKKLGIPVVGIADTNANPEIEYPIPANDDAVRSVKYIFDKLAEVIAATAKAKKEEVAVAESDATDRAETSNSAKSKMATPGKEEEAENNDDKLEKLEKPDSVKAETGEKVEEIESGEENFEKLEMNAAEEVVVKKTKPAEKESSKIEK